jgi:4-hydroxybutyryl-CoA dehydratase/vinylacetyl-CoA-Delta-isomerase
VPVDAPGNHDRAAARRGVPARSSSTARRLFSRQATDKSTGVVIFDTRIRPWERVFYAGEWEHSGTLTYNYATHHRQTCIGARAGFGDLLIGAGALMCEGERFRHRREVEPARADGSS